MKKIYLKRKRKISKKKLVIFLGIILIISILYLLNLINKKLTPIFIESAEIELNKISTIIVNNAISTALSKEVENLDIFEIIKNSNDEIQTIDFNPIAVNKVLNVVTIAVQNDLLYLKNGNLDSIKIKQEFSEERIKDLKQGIIVKVPIGSITSNTLFSNLGPKIPIKLSYIGDVNSNIVTKISQYGINNAMVEVGVKVDVVAQIVLPFTIKKTVFTYEMPLVIKMVQGTVPNYYGGDLIKNSAIYSEK